MYIVAFLGKNIPMATAIDYIGASFIVILVTFAWSTYLFKSFVGALAFSIAFGLIAVFIAYRIIKSKQKPYGYDRLALQFCIQGNEYVVRAILRALKNPKNIESGQNYILLEDCIIISNFKFAQIGISDVASACRLAKSKARKEIFLLCKSAERKAYEIAKLEDIKINVVKIKPLFKFLAKHDALPDLKPIKHKLSLHALAETILSRRNFKNYVFSGTVLVLVSFLTPLKIYYIVLGTLSLVLAILCLTPLGNGRISSPKVFELLEKEVEDEYRRE